MVEYLNKLAQRVDSQEPFTLSDVADGITAEEVRHSARLLDAYVAYRMTCRQSVDLEEIRSAFPWMYDSDELLQQAVQLSISSMIAAGHECHAVADTLTRSHPLAAKQIARVVHGWLSIDGEYVASPSIRGLPCRIGTDDLDGMPRFELHSKIDSNGSSVRYEATDSLTEDSVLPVLVQVSRTNIAKSKSLDAWAEPDLSLQVWSEVLCMPIEGGRLSEFENYASFHVDSGDVLTFRECQKNGRYDWREAARISIEVAKGLEAVHVQGLCHGQVTPWNVVAAASAGSVQLLTDVFRIRYADAALGSLDSYDKNGVMPFMAPETFVSSELTPSSDIYQLGGLLLWLTTGMLPNGPTAERAASFLEQDSPRQSFSLNRLPPRIAGVIRKALSSDPSNRYRSAFEFRDQLERLLSNEPASRQEPYSTRAAWWIRRSGKVFIPIAATLLFAGAISYGLKHRNEQHLLQQAGRLELSLDALEQKLVLAESRKQDALDDRARMITQAQDLVREWQRSMIRADDGDPIASLVFLTLTEILEFGNDELRNELLAGSSVKVAAEADSFWEASRSDLEAVLWQIVASHTLRANGDVVGAAEYVERANQMLDRILIARDPMQDLLLGSDT